jgi:large subunit ribosomal protein L24
MKIKKQDVVRVMIGAYKGKQGKVLATMPEKRRCIVEGVNFKTKHQRPLSPENPGGILKKEGSIHVSNLRIVCPKCGQAARVGKKSIGDKNVRTCKKCGEMIDE